MTHRLCVVRETDDGELWVNFRSDLWKAFVRIEVNFDSFALGWVLWPSYPTGQRVGR